MLLNNHLRGDHMSKESMTLGQFMDRPHKSRPHRSVLLIRIPGGKRTSRIIRSIFNSKKA